MKFDGYHFTPELKKGLAQLGFKRPTDIQYKSISHIMTGDDVFAVAQTGTGKTGAYAIPIINAIQVQKKKERRPDGVKCIVMVPTHELALQQEIFFNEVAKYTKVKILALIGGVSQDPQIETLEKRVDILIATPGRMFDLMAQGHLKIHRVNTLVLDEADHMLDLGFIKDINDLCDQLPKKRQTLFFSATINDKIKKLAYSTIKKTAIRIQFSKKDPVSKNITHAVAFIEMDDKRFFLERIIKENSEIKILVFARTKVRVERVSKALARVSVDSLTIHSDKTQEERNDALENFSKGEVKVLVATDVSARGIDIPNVELVINYDLPDKAENYVHRVGRTGRGKFKGEAIAFCAEHEKDMLKQIEEYVHGKIKVLDISKADYYDTKLFTDDQKDKLGKLMEEIEELEGRRKKGKSKSKKKR
jgi:ATP-dependent RNA helicase RhlE